MACPVAGRQAKLARLVDRAGVNRHETLRHVTTPRRPAGPALSRLIIVAFEATALNPRIDPSGNIRPQPDVHGEQRLDFEAAQLPTLFAQLRERSLRGT